MKKYLVTLPLLLGFICRGQEPPKTVLDKSIYIKKSKAQKTTGFIVAATGVALAGVGLVIATINVTQVFDPNSSYHKKNRKSADLFGYTGLGLMCASVPFFISASANRKKAASLSLQVNPFWQPSQNSFAMKAQAGLSFKVNF